MSLKHRLELEHPGEIMKWFKCKFKFKCKCK